jgi:amino-acid N-acetyltransferase
MDRVTIRPAREQDRPQVEAMLVRAGLPADGLDAQFGEGFAVAEEDGRVAGAAGVEVYGTFGLLRSVVVDGAMRGRGLGVRLADDRVAWARRRGLDAVYLLTTTAAGFFPRLGFVRIARDDVPAEVRASPEFAALCPASAAVMALRLDGGR